MEELCTDHAQVDNQGVLPAMIITHACLLHALCLPRTGKETIGNSLDSLPLKSARFPTTIWFEAFCLNCYAAD